MTEGNAEQYKSSKYQRTVEIESRAYHGIDSEDRYKKEADFAIKSANLKPEDFQSTDKILDLACGGGGHSRKFADQLGVEVEARDISDTLLNQARNVELQQTSDNTRKKINFAYGDMGNILKNVPENQKFKAITIMGTSFMYLGSKKAHQKALEDYYSLLEPGGKLILQFRDKGGDGDENKQKEWQKNFAVTSNIQKATGESGQFGEYAQKDEEVEILKDLEKGDSFYFYGVPLKSTEGLTYKEARPDEGKRAGWYDSDDIQHKAFGRAYLDKEGHEEDLGPTYFMELLRASSFEKNLKPMIEKAGFNNVSLHQESLSPDGYYWQYAVVAEKPLNI